ncbi:MAG: hypothetical protein COA94_09115 [Rickettsiales bacterium]|nr:MAG: hypothetical protein COA94_09115 [Rickettsiales bacterium]
MRYLGGKSRIASKIVGLINSETPLDSPFYDVFAGGLSITCAAATTRTGPVYANDRCTPLITMYQRWSTGWRPKKLGYLDYLQLKRKQDPLDPHTALAGFGMSFAGIWFGSYARDSVNTSYFDVSVRSLEKGMGPCQDVEFTCKDFSALSPPSESVVYLDPPYKGTASYRYHQGFSTRRLLSWSANLPTPHVFMSEYESPGPNWEEVGSFDTQGSGLSRKQEKLFRLISSPP